MEVLSIGTITTFTNVSKRQQYLFKAGLDQKVSEALANWVSNDLRNKFPDSSVVLISYETKVGCIITPILIGALIVKTSAASAAVGTGLTLTVAGGAAYKFLTDYDKIKTNLKAIADDVKSLWIKITHRKTKQNIGKEERGSDGVEHVVQVYESIPDEYKKYFAAGKDTVVISERETITYHKVSVMRGDIKEEINKEITEKEIKTISLKPAQ